MDSLAREYGLKNGVASYWQAKHITMFSKEHLHIFTVFSDMSPWYHVMNQNWYYYKDRSHKKAREFDFVIGWKIDSAAIRKYLGEPVDTLHCPGEFDIYRFKEFRYDIWTHLPVRNQK